jgi:hypothetical protein
LQACSTADKIVATHDLSIFVRRIGGLLENPVLRYELAAPGIWSIVGYDIVKFVVSLNWVYGQEISNCLFFCW